MLPSRSLPTPRLVEIATPNPSRRRFVLGAAAVGVAAASGLAAPRLARSQTAPFTLPALPYAEDALAPVISSQTLGFHYGKHHAGYVAALNRLAESEGLQGQTLLEIIKAAAGKPEKAAVFNNAAQIWNHTFYWNSLRPNGGGKPSGRLAELVDQSFGGYDKLKEQLAATAIGQFGSGWGWLCFEGGKLTLRRTPNAETPITAPGVKVLLTIDVWEHAYYLDYKNRRADYVNAVIDKLLNWEFAERNLAA